MAESEQIDRQPVSSRLESLQNPAYRLLWGSGLLVFLAFQNQQTARGWLAFELTGTNTALGGVIFAFGVTSLVAVPVSGVLADRISKRAILMFAQATMAAAAFGVALAITTGVIQYWMLVAAGGVQGLGISLFGPARLAMTADVVERHSLSNAIFLGNASIQVTRIFGPALAGLLIGLAFFGVEGVYYLGGTLAVLSVIAVMRLPRGLPKTNTDQSGLSDLLDGVRYVRANPELSRLLVMSLLIVMFGFPHIAFLPALVSDVYQRDSWAFGLLISAAAVGAVSTSFALANSKQTRLSALQTRAAFLFGVALVAFALVPSYWAAVFVMIFVGGASAAFQALNNSLVLNLAHVEFHGRVQSLIMLSFTGFGLASLPIGRLADIFGIRFMISVMGALVIASAGVGVLWRKRIVEVGTPYGI